jgi:type II secretory pathway predicted ATPase ExeA
VAPLSKPRLSSDAKFQQLHTSLLNLEKSGQRVCLLIDEAHGLSIPSLKHLKRLYELEPAGGYGSLISVILIGQPELKIKLDERNPEIRELVQRCDVVTLKPIAVAELEDFINHRVGRVGLKATDIIDQSGITAIADCLQGQGGQSQLWPLLIGNFLIAAMNKAAHIGEDAITADVVKEVATWKK